MPKQREVNWGGNVTYQAARVQHPETLGELSRLVRHADRVRILGTRHTFNTLPDSTGDLISLRSFDQILSLDQEDRTVTLQGGVQYSELGQFLHANGYALGNLPSLPHLSVAGACSTGTHGSGVRHQGLASAVLSLELLTADGEQVTCSRERSGERFDGMVVALGALGAVTRLTLRVEPSYQVRQDVYERLSLDQVATRFGDVMIAGDSVSLFTTWQDERFDTLWLKRRVAASDVSPAPVQLFGGVLAEQDHHPVWGASAESCTVQRGAPGAWHERLPHFRAGHTPSCGQEIQSEYLFPVEYAPAALRALFSIGARLAPLLYVSEVRTVAADPFWLSPAYGRDSVAVHFTWRPDEPAVRSILHEVEAVLAPFGARPHWGKVFETTPEQLEVLVPRLSDFRQLTCAFDPIGKFRNNFLNRLIFGS
ncbi:FAD-binding protein (plasmid) [Deinococcus radiomollis]|uniref:FAD-binding protein n=1 Tax=Deinococcus radiomollis TaxID=468916 RepID=UPI003892847E